jgi:hypothetical protein
MQNCFFCINECNSSLTALPQAALMPDCPTAYMSKDARRALSQQLQLHQPVQMRSNRWYEPFSGTIAAAHLQRTHLK